jgi:hypothetical protein
MPEAPLSQKTQISSDPQGNRKAAQLVIELLDALCDRPNSFSLKKAKPFFSALWRQKNLTLLRHFFDAIQAELDHIGQLLEERGALPNELANIRINNMLCYLAYTEPDVVQRSMIKVPVYNEISKTWAMQPYRIKPIELTPKWMRLFATPYYAYGLEPEHTGISAQLLFMGTTYPAARGSFWTYFFDLFPGFSVGSLLFKLGKSPVKKFVNKQTCETVLCHGQSLGGSLSIQTAKACPKIRAFAHVPAGQLRQDKKFLGENVTVYVQGQDPISKIGYLPPKAHYFYVTPPAGLATKAGLMGKIFSHAASLASNPEAVLREVTPEWVEQRSAHTGWTLLYHILSFVMMPLILIPCLLANTLIRIITFPFKA